MKILVINAGSSSLKYQLIDMENEQMLCKGNCERIGLEMGIFGHKTADGRSKNIEVPMKDHTAAFQQVKNALTDSEVGVISDLSEVSAVGHRIVQGGALFSESVLVDEKVIEGIESLIPLAPLHNAAHVQGIRACREVFGEDVPEVVVFDTAFHSTMPPEAYMFAIPYEYYEKYQVRRYGFHGTSHRYVSARALDLLGRANNPEGTKIICCHLGNGSSLSAVKDGKVVDTTMGLGPLAGVPMGTRCGDIDATILEYLMGRYNYDIKTMLNILNKKSGVLGISGVSSDFRDLDDAAEKGNERAQLALDKFVYEVKKSIGAYAAAMGGVDAIVFTAGVGENSVDMRVKLVEGLEYMGVKIDPEKNKTRGVEAEVQADDSKVKIFVIPTNEELMIAKDTAALAR